MAHSITRVLRFKKASVADLVRIAQSGSLSSAAARFELRARGLPLPAYLHAAPPVVWRPVRPAT